MSSINSSPHQPLINIKVDGIQKQIDSSHKSKSNNRSYFRAPSLFVQDQYSSDQKDYGNNVPNHNTSSPFRQNSTLTYQGADYSGDEGNSPSNHPDGRISPPGNHVLTPTMEQHEELAGNSLETSLVNNGMDSGLQGGGQQSTKNNGGRGEDKESNGNNNKLQSNSAAKPKISTSLNLESVLQQQRQATTIMNNSNRSNHNNSKDTSTAEPQVVPPMSTRRKQQLAMSPQQQAISHKQHFLSSSSESQPIFQAIWKVILTTSFEREALQEYMKKSNLIGVPIRAIHYSEVLCLFRKAHGPLLQIQKVDNSMRASVQKKASLVTASDTVQGFISYQVFCRDLVQMLGDAVLLVKPDIYTLIVELIFEAVQVRTVDKGESVIYLRRITDIVSPFQNQITDNLPVHHIFNVQTLDSLVKYTCMQDPKAAEIKRLVQRRFIPSALLKKDAKEETDKRLWDNIEKVIQHQQWKENRALHEAITLQRKSVDGTHLGNQKLFGKISHISKIHRTVTLSPPTKLQTRDRDDDSPDRNQSEITSDAGNNDIGSATMKPKLPLRDTPMSIADPTIQALSRVDHARVDGVSQLDSLNKQFHVKVDNQVPRTPQAHHKRPKNATGMIATTESALDSQMSNTNQTMDLSPKKEEQFSFQGSKISRPVTNENTFRQAVARMQENTSQRKVGKNSVVAGNYKEDLDMPLKTMDVMHLNSKYRKLAFKTRTLSDAKMMAELKRFGIHKAKFDQMRQLAAAALLESGSERDKRSSRPASNGGLDDTSFNVQINSKGKLDEFRNDIQPIDEMNEIANDTSFDIESPPQTGEMATTLRLDKHQELFDFRFVLKSHMDRAENDSHHNQQMELDSPTNNQREIELESTIQEPQLQYQNDYLNVNKRFNSKNLQQCRQKNKQLIADNMRQFNEIRNQQGYNACLFTGHRYNGSKPVKARKISKIQVPKLIQAKNKQLTFDNFSPPSTANGAFSPTFINQSLLKFHHRNHTISPPNEQARTMQTTLDSSIITNLKLMNSTQQNTASVSNKAYSKSGSRGAPWGRRPSQPRANLSHMGSSDGSQRPKFRNIMSPESQKESSHRPRAAHDSTNLGDAINCRTIPKMIQEMQARMTEKGVGTPDEFLPFDWKTHLLENAQAIPIHLNLATVGEEARREFSPFSMHMDGLTVKDSIHVQGTQSRSDPHNDSVQSKDDGICTVRADSHLEAKEMFSQKLNRKKLSHMTHEQMLQQDQSFSKPQSSLSRQAKIVLVAPKSLLRNSKMRNNEIDEGSNENSQELTVETSKPARLVCTADQKSRNKAQTGLRSIKVGDSKNEDDAKDSFMMHMNDQIKVSMVLEDSNSGQQLQIQVNEDQAQDQQQNLDLKDQIIKADIDRWNSAHENPVLLLNTSVAQGMHQTQAITPVVDDDQLSHHNYTRQRPRGALDLEWKTSSHPKPLTSNAEPGNKRSHVSQNVRLQTHMLPPNQLTTFVAPRRAMMTRKQQLKIKTPINLLAMHDYKGTRNLNITAMINPDLITSRHETETIKLSQSTKSPVIRRNVNRYFSINDPSLTPHVTRFQPPMSKPSRTPTPIKIVDLSVRPEPFRQTRTINQEYLRHGPFLGKQKQPLKQEALRNLTKRGFTTEIEDQTALSKAVARNSERSQAVVDQKSSTIQTSKALNNFDLRSMVNYLVSSPVISPKSNNHYEMPSLPKSRGEESKYERSIIR